MTRAAVGGVYSSTEFDCKTTKRPVRNSRAAFFVLREKVMIIHVAENTAEQVDVIRENVEALGARTRLSGDRLRVVVAGEKDDRQVAELVQSISSNAQITTLNTAYRLANRQFGKNTRRIPLGGEPGVVVGGEQLVVIAGPCAVEGKEMLELTAAEVWRAGATVLRGGAFKPRTSPYSFQGLGRTGLEILAEARRKFGLPVVTEVLDIRQIELVAEYVDVLQIGARNMQNFALLSAVGEVRRPVVLKRGPAATVKEFLLAAEYVLERGNEDVILCERGIRTYETVTRNTLDIAAIPVLKQETHLPVIADPSHACGRADLVSPLARAAIAAGADGLMIEVHPCPERAQSDGDQSLKPDVFSELMRSIKSHAEAVDRTIQTTRNPEMLA